MLADLKPGVQLGPMHSRFKVRRRSVDAIRSTACLRFVCAAADAQGSDGSNMQEWSQHRSKCAQWTCLVVLTIAGRDKGAMAATGPSSYHAS